MPNNVGKRHAVFLQNIFPVHQIINNLKKSINPNLSIPILNPYIGIVNTYFSHFRLCIFANPTCTLKLYRR